MTRDYDLQDGAEFVATPVAVMHSPHKVHVGTPRQPRAETADPGCGGTIVVKQGLQNLLQDLEGFSHIWVVYWCNYCYGWNDLVAPPRDPGGTKRGLFATRAPHRPNPIGLSVLELKRVDRRRLEVGAHDVLDGTPILDIKPYLAYADSVPGARGGWVDELGQETAPDHRDWQTTKRRR